ncbi:MAG: GTP cyclohydrolase I [Nitrososphaerales archaeon]
MNHQIQDYDERRELLAECVKSILEILDEPMRPGLENTPDRVARMYLDEVYNNRNALTEELNAIFPEPTSTNQMVILKDIPVKAWCEHHLIPYFGMAYVGYIPQGAILGLSKVARLVAAAGRGFSIQERLTDQIADAIDQKLHPYGVMVVVEAAHTCMIVRGVEAPTSRTITSAVRGVFRDSGAARAEFLSLIGRKV